MTMRRVPSRGRLAGPERQMIWRAMQSWERHAFQALKSNWLLLRANPAEGNFPCDRRDFQTAFSRSQYSVSALSWAHSFQAQHSPRQARILTMSAPRVMTPQAA